MAFPYISTQRHLAAIPVSWRIRGNL